MLKSDSISLYHDFIHYFISSSRVEQSVFALLRTRDMAFSRYKEFGIPVNWLMDSGIVGKVTFSWLGIMPSSFSLFLRGRLLAMRSRFLSISFQVKIY